jgi:ParB family chromosome partitioning protein
MKIVEIGTDQIEVPDGNPNEMDDSMRDRLGESIRRFGLVVPLVVRPVGTKRFETVGGAQRLGVVRDIGIESIPCVVVEANDAEARLLSQALNHIAGQDNLGLRADIVRHLLEDFSTKDIQAVLPDSIDSLKGIASLGQSDIAKQLKAWQTAQSARLRHLQFQLASSQLQMVEEALERANSESSTDSTNPNRRGNALYKLCKTYLER